ncbi:MBL fold metallo-hydrolase [Clostridium sp. 'White wine YQ']|uniref:MBL fold metallo-hydrolase n=1 Tax=Clostridium sp. 'White wine YQ' TaxID=3027474 RepID=UPI0023662E0D|nr:MBL fold metallo-hydrolase [Clostridium sp. 'White wine YQ']MDD7796333.1 MBL fold metallo-hydrolase [Clostridium sp. 'White wine YQ']
MKIANGIEMLEIKANVMGRESSINPVLIWDEENVILVDTGFPGQMKEINEAIESAGIDIDRLNTIILTHQDIDHIGSALSLVKNSENEIKVLCHEEEKKYIQGDETPVKLAKLEKSLSSMPNEMKGMYEKLKAGFSLSKVRVDKTLKDGEELTFVGGTEVIYTPGHTPGHICLYIKKNKVLIAGDLLTVNDGVLSKASPNINYDTNLSDKSLEKLKKYDIEKVICYHGGLYEKNVNERISELSREA